MIAPISDRTVRQPPPSYTEILQAVQGAIASAAVGVSRVLLLSEHTQLQDARRIAQAVQQQQLAQPVLSEAEQQAADAQAAHDAETDALRLRVLNCLQEANVHIAEAEARHTEVDV